MSKNNGKKISATLLAAICTGLVATTSLRTGLSIGIAVSIVLILTNLIMNIFKDRAPSNMLILFYMVLVAFLTSIIYIITQAYLPELIAELGVYMPILIFSVCIIVQIVSGEENYSINIALKTSIGFILALGVIGIVREVLGKNYTAMLEAPAAFLTAGILLAIASGIFNKKAI